MPIISKNKPKPEVDMQLASEILTAGLEDPTTLRYVGGCLLLGSALESLVNVGRSDEEILLSTKMTLENIRNAKKIAG